ncbi:MAG: hypothetical protein MUC87_00465 [Bacteroidia bacterium]|nr:hypothetical protein [Bacteroidia bacterium]
MSYPKRGKVTLHLQRKAEFLFEVLLWIEGGLKPGPHSTKLIAHSGIGRILICGNHWLFIAKCGDIEGIITEQTIYIIDFQRETKECLVQLFSRPERITCMIRMGMPEVRKQKRRFIRLF